MNVNKGELVVQYAANQVHAVCTAIVAVGSSFERNERYYPSFTVFDYLIFFNIFFSVLIPSMFMLEVWKGMDIHRHSSYTLILTTAAT